MATIRKLPSGNYRIEKMVDGVRYGLTIDHKPRKSEADFLILEASKDKGGVKTSDTFASAAEHYIKSKNNILSPATVSGYHIVLNRIPASFKGKLLRAITRDDVQICINQLAEKYSPKSVRNTSGFISAVMRAHFPAWTSCATLPQKKPAEFYVPEKEDVKAILTMAKGTPYEIGLWLATFGLRRSEICAIEKSDLDGNVLSINKALVPDKDGEYVLKSTKTVESCRKIVISDYVADLIRAVPEGRVYRMTPPSLNNFLKRASRDLNIPYFSLHKFRHFFASTARETMGDTYVEDMGGWKHGSQVMRKVYDYSQRKVAEKAKQDFAKRISEIL